VTVLPVPGRHPWEDEEVALSFGDYQGLIHAVNDYYYPAGCKEGVGLGLFSLSQPF
jgi:hypothetical protein